MEYAKNNFYNYSGANLSCGIKTFVNSNKKEVIERLCL